jgi:hypothetical protein
MVARTWNQTTEAVSAYGNAVSAHKGFMLRFRIAKMSFDRKARLDYDFARK